MILRYTRGVFYGCHPERSEGSPEEVADTQANQRDQSIV
jgi:hypothetical protein